MQKRCREVANCTLQLQPPGDLGRQEVHCFLSTLSRCRDSIRSLPQAALVLYVHTELKCTPAHGPGYQLPLEPQSIALTISLPTTPYSRAAHEPPLLTAAKIPERLDEAGRDLRNEAGCDAGSFFEQSFDGSPRHLFVLIQQ